MSPPTVWSSDPDKPGTGTLQVYGYNWATYDYGEQLATTPAVQAALGLEEPRGELRQCLFLNLAGALLSCGRGAPAAQLPHTTLLGAC